MDGDQIDSAQIDWEEQDAEIEALECIFLEELEITARRPYKFQI